MLARPFVPIAEGAQKREILSACRFENFLILSFCTSIVPKITKIIRTAIKQDKFLGKKGEMMMLSSERNVISIRDLYYKSSSIQ